MNENISAIKLVISFIKANTNLHRMAAGILVVLSLLQTLPAFGIIFAATHAVLSFSIQVFFGRHAFKIKNDEEMEEFAYNTDIKEFMTTYLDIGAGAFLGSFIISFISIIFIAITLGSVTAGSENMQEVLFNISHSYMFIPGVLILMLVALLWYVWPAVMGMIIKSEDLPTAFKSCFKVFSKDLWRSIANRKYFSIVSIWSVILIFAVIFSYLLLKFILFMPIAVLILYFMTLYGSIIAVYARKASK